MTERLSTTLLITAILLASAFVTATTWAGLRIISSGGTMQQRSATATVPDGPIHAYLIPVTTQHSNRAPGLVPAGPTHPSKHHRWQVQSP
jgi:hypothetical protein